jgi:type-1 restriction enzyme ecoR124II specificity protein
MGKAVENIGDCIPNQQINAIINDGSFSSRYLVHALSNMRTTLQRKASQGGGTMPLINKSDFSLIELSLPPLKEQYRIADILDDFDTLVNDLSFGLPAEIEARRKQYEYYRDRLLTFPEKK